MAKVENSQRKLKTRGGSKNHGGVFGCHSSLACCMLFIISSFNAIYTTVACQCDHVFFPHVAKRIIIIINNDVFKVPISKNDQGNKFCSNQCCKDMKKLF